MGSKLPTNLPQLQNFIKRNPENYREEFENQYECYIEYREIFKLKPSFKNVEFYDLVMFIAQVSRCYPRNQEVQQFPEDIVQLLRREGPVMHTDIRMGLLKALILLRNKDLLPPMLLMDVCFDLLRCQDKLLRKVLQAHIISDIKNINAGNKNMVLNRKLQDFFSSKLNDDHAVAVKTALDVMIELYRKNVWKDKRNVNIIATACTSKVAKIMVAALKFFVGNDEGEQEDDDSEPEDEAPDVRQAQFAMKVNKKTKQKRQNKIEKLKKNVCDIVKKKEAKQIKSDFSAIHLIHDPQTLAENMFKHFNKRNERFEVKLLMMNMISRLIGLHQLYLSNFYPTLQRFLRPHQREVTKVMQYAAQASHQHMPPDDLSPMLQCIANNFVSERFTPEVMAMGINAIKELCNRNIHAMDEDLLQDLLGYKNHKDKGVFMAARSLLTLFREKNPALLARRNQGVPTEHIKEVGISQFGENTAKNFIPGAEILAFRTNAEDFGSDTSDCDESEEEKEEDEADDSQNSTAGDESVVSQEDDVEDDEEDDVEDDEEDDSAEDEEDDCAEDEEDESMADETATTIGDESESEDKDESNTKTVPVIDTSKVLNKKQAIKEVMKLSAEDRAGLAEDIMSSRLLTDEDFARIDAVQEAKKNERFSNKKRKRVEEDEEREIVPLSSIEMVYKKKRHDKAAKMQSALEGREDRDEFGSRKGKNKTSGATSNKEKAKKKAFNMVKHKVRYTKQMSTFQDKKAKLKISMLRQLKNN